MSPPADLTRGFADRVSARTHCLVLGIPASHVDEYMRLFVEHGEETPLQAKFDFLREVLRLKRQSPAEDSLSDLVTSDLDPAEVEGLTFTLMVSGRDSVAYMIATSMVALLSNPDQFESLRDNPEMIDGATEEFLRAGAMFVTLFPRTAAEDVVVDGMLIPEGTTVAVSPVAVNHDARRFPDPESFDISRDAYGHFGFGFGIHGCVGQQVARVEIKESVTQLIGALPTLRLIHADQADALPFAHEVGTYQAGRVLVDWS